MKLLERIAEGTTTVRDVRLSVALGALLFLGGVLAGLAFMLLW